MKWTIHHKVSTESTNLDARGGIGGDVFTADFQTAGRGRLDHTWHSAPGENLMLSAVLDVTGHAAEQVATLPLVVGYAALRSVQSLLVPHPCAISLKWPNDVYADGRKIAGILCERQGDAVIAGIGINVNQTRFPSGLAGRATSLALLTGAGSAHGAVERARDAFLSELAAAFALWTRGGFAAIHPLLAPYDFLRGRSVAVRQTDGDTAPVRGLCGGIAGDGSLMVAGERIYAGEAHVEF